MTLNHEPAPDRLREDIPGNLPHGVSLSRRNLLALGGMSALGAMFAGFLPSAAVAAPARSGDRPFEIVIVIYKNGTLLDFAGPNEVFQRLSNARVRFASIGGGPVTLEYGIVFGKTERLSDIASADLLLVPGGPDLTEPMQPEMQAQLLRIADKAKYVTSVCTGSLVLAATGMLRGKRSACHWACLNLLKDYGAIPDPARFVKDGRFMSGGGVTSGIDFALRVATEVRGQQEAQLAQLSIEYDPDPPFNCGHPRIAPPELLDLAEKAMPGCTKGVFNLVR